jgi:hypothetical protein
VGPYVPGTVKAHSDLFKTNCETGLINVQSQMGHLHLTTNLQVYDAFRKVQGALCLVDGKTLSNKLQAIAGEATPYALMDLYGPGHTFYIAGAVSFIAK